MKNENIELCTNDKVSDEITFSFAFRVDGDSFQSIIERILISKIAKKD